MMQAVQVRADEVLLFTSTPQSHNSGSLGRQIRKGLVKKGKTGQDLESVGD